MKNFQDSLPAMAAKVTIAKAVTAATSRAGHSGTTLPGRIVKGLDGGVIGRMSARLARGSVLVSATNGKTTTSAMIAGILQMEGLKVVTNREGANLAAGVATALLRDARLTGAPRADVGLFEVDEFAFPEVASETVPRLVLLMNLFRDQLDRYGELEHIAERWREAVEKLPSESLAVINADDPLVAEMTKDRTENCLYFGIEDASAGGLVMQHASDSKYCSNCGELFEYETVFIGHMGKYHCNNCGNRRPSPTVFADNVCFDGMRGSSFSLVTPGGTVEVAIPMPGLYNLYNALAAAACAHAMGIGLQAVKSGLEAFSAAFGRVEELTIEGKRAVLLLVKNPAGYNEVVRTLLIEPGKKYVMAALNDRIADGRDISWIWDVDLEMLAPEVEAAVCSGTRAEEMAMRLKYAGVAEKRLTVERDLAAALKQALAKTPEGYTLFVLPTYTAMLALRQAIHRSFETETELKDLVWR